jgi:hypothetical protein
MHRSPPVTSAARFMVPPNTDFWCTAKHQEIREEARPACRAFGRPAPGEPENGHGCIGQDVSARSKNGLKIVL